MIKDSKLGLKVAVDPEEAFWEKLKEETLARIESNKHEILINEAVLKLAEGKLKANV